MRLAHLRRALLAYLVFSAVEMGSWVAVLVWAHSQGDAGTVGLVAVLQTISAAFLAPVLASGVDRVPRALAPPISYFLVGISLATVAWGILAGAPFALVTTSAVVATVLIGACRPAHHSLTPCLTGTPTDLMAANVVATAAEGIGLFAGPAIVGAVMTVSSPGVALLVCVGLMVVATLLTSGFPPVSLPEPLSGPLGKGGLMAGLRRLRDEPTSGVPIAVAGMGGVVGGALDVLMVVLAIEVLMIGDGGVGYLNAALGVGAIVGGLGSSLLVGRRRLSPPLMFTGLLTGLAMLLVAWRPDAAVLLAGAGVGYSVIGMVTKTMLQRLNPPRLMGRMFGWLEGVQLAGLALGSGLAPLAIALFGTPGSFGVFGVALPLAMTLLWRGLREADRRADMPTEALGVLRRVDVISALPPEVLEALARGAALRRFTKGTAVVTQGSVGEEMYVVGEGSVQVSRGGQLLATLGPGDIFGEIALLSDAPRIATVTTASDTTLLAIGREAFLGALSTDPATRFGVEGLAAARRRETLGEA